MRCQLRMFNADSKISDVRDWIQTQVATGAEFICPCCDKHYTPRKRLIRPEWVAFAKRVLDDHGIENMVPVYDLYPSIMAKMSNDWQFLRHFGLMETSLNEGPEKTHSGNWSATALLHAFIHEGARVPEWKIIMFNSPIRESETLVAFHDVMSLKWGFDLRDVLRIDQNMVDAMDWNSIKRKRSKKKKKVASPQPVTVQTAIVVNVTAPVTDRPFVF